MFPCINTTAFIFDKVKTSIKHKKQTHHHKNNKCHLCSNINEEKRQCDNRQCFKNDDILIFKLTKDNFLSSTLAISTSFNESWDFFKLNIYCLINKYFVITLTPHCKNIMHSLYGLLLKIKYCKCCDVISLYFKYNISNELIINTNTNI